MTEVLSELSKQDLIRTVVIRGSGDQVFSAGYDLSALPTHPSGEKEKMLKETPPLEMALRAIRRFPYPVIAMINGSVYGGACELVVGCDMRIAAAHAKMSMPPAKLGLVYPYTGYRRFFNLLGLGPTLEIFLTGQQYDSRRCLDMGMWNYVIEREKLQDFTYSLAKELSENAPLSLKGSKQALYKIAENTLLTEKEEDALRSMFIQSLRSEDLEEGKRAFAEKRKPCFKGR
jgi:enoyl-CoA hydratase/carnithine racemase